MRYWGKAHSGAWHALRPYKRTDDKGREYVETLCGRFIALQGVARHGGVPTIDAPLTCAACRRKADEEQERGPTGVVKELLDEVGS